MSDNHVLVVIGLSWVKKHSFLDLHNVNYKWEEGIAGWYFSRHIAFFLVNISYYSPDMLKFSSTRAIAKYVTLPCI